MANHVEDFKNFGKLYQDLVDACPETMRAFDDLHQASFEEGAVSVLNKELIALGISIAVKCTVCIDGHVLAAIEAGATKEQISETVSVAVLMGGGPSTAYGALAIEAMHQFFAKQ